MGSPAEPKVRIRDLLTKPAGIWAESHLTEPTVLNLVSVELFVLLVNRMGQPSLECWSDRSGNEGDQASDDPQDDQRDRQTSSTNASSFMKGSSFVSLHMVRMDDLSSQYNEEDFL
jgi:hypothetical protein